MISSFPFRGRTRPVAGAMLIGVFVRDIGEQLLCLQIITADDR